MAEVMFESWPNEDLIFEECGRKSLICDMTVYFPDSITNRYAFKYL